MSLATLFFAFAAVAVAVLGLAALAGVAPSRAVRGVALGLAAAGLGTAYFAGSELLGRPKPARLALLERGADAAQLAGSHYIEGEAIWLWLILPGEDAPRAYALPWSREAAEALRRAEAQAEENGTRVEVRAPFRRNEAPNEPVFRAPPRPPLPEKETG